MNSALTYWQLQMIVHIRSVYNLQPQRKQIRCPPISRTRCGFQDALKKQQKQHKPPQTLLVKMLKI